MWAIATGHRVCGIANPEQARSRSCVGTDRTDGRRDPDHRAVARPDGAVISTVPVTPAAPTRPFRERRLAGGRASTGEPALPTRRGTARLVAPLNASAGDRPSRGAPCSRSFPLRCGCNSRAPDCPPLARCVRLVRCGSRAGRCGAGRAGFAAAMEGGRPRCLGPHVGAERFARIYVETGRAIAHEVWGGVRFDSLAAGASVLALGNSEVGRAEAFVSPKGGF